MGTQYIVIAREDRNADGSKGRYTLATRTVFETEAAADAYKGTISDSSEPLVIPGDYRGFRFSAEGKCLGMLPNERACQECGEPCTESSSPGVWVHVAADGGTDFDADADHTAVPEEDDGDAETEFERCDECGAVLYTVGADQHETGHTSTCSMHPDNAVG